MDHFQCHLQVFVGDVDTDACDRHASIDFQLGAAVPSPRSRRALKSPERVALAVGLCECSRTCRISRVIEHLSVEIVAFVAICANW